MSNYEEVAEQVIQNHHGGDIIGQGSLPRMGDDTPTVWERLFIHDAGHQGLYLRVFFVMFYEDGTGQLDLISSNQASDLLLDRTMENMKSFRYNLVDGKVMLVDDEAIR